MKFINLKIMYRISKREAEMMYKVYIIYNIMFTTENGQDYFFNLMQCSIEQ